MFSTSFIQQPKQYRSVLSYRCKLTGGERIPHNIMDRMSGVRCSKNDHVPSAPNHHWTIPVVADGHKESVISSVCKTDDFMLMMIKHLENYHKKVKGAPFETELNIYSCGIQQTEFDHFAIGWRGQFLKRSWWHSENKQPGYITGNDVVSIFNLNWASLYRPE